MSHIGEPDADRNILITGGTDGMGKATANKLAKLGARVREMRHAAEHIRGTFDRLDVLVHSAGGLFPRKRTQTDEGLEMSFAVGYLARFVLTRELLDLLRAAPDPQILSIAGAGAGFGRVDFDNLNGEKSYSMFGAVAKYGGFRSDR